MTLVRLMALMPCGCDRDAVSRSAARPQHAHAQHAHAHGRAALTCSSSVTSSGLIVKGGPVVPSGPSGKLPGHAETLNRLSTLPTRRAKGSGAPPGPLARQPQGQQRSEGMGRRGGGAAGTHQGDELALGLEQRGGLGRPGLARGGRVAGGWRQRLCCLWRPPGWGAAAAEEGRQRLRCCSNHLKWGGTLRWSGWIAQRKVQS